MFEWLFKYPPELFRQGELVLAPAWPDSVTSTVLLGLVAVLGVVLLSSALFGRRLRPLTAGRRLTLAALQGVFLLGVAVLLARPTLQLTMLTPGANAVAVLLDGSASMSLPAAAGPESRLDAATAALERTLLAQLSELGNVATFVFGTSAERRSLDGVAADRSGTRLVAALEQVLASFAGAPLAAVVVLSDGADNDTGPMDVAGLSAQRVPVHTVGVGPAELVGEVEIADVVLPAEASPGTRVVAEITLRHTASGPARVTVRDGDRLLGAATLTLVAGVPLQRQALTFDSGPGGVRELLFEVEAPVGDGLAQNNRLERLLTVSERRRRVLYLEGEPRWEYKFLRRAVAGDDVLALTSWLRTTDRKTYRQDVTDADELSSGFPESLAELYGYDVIVLGSLAATDLDQRAHDWLESFVAERGGSLLALAGRQALADGGWDVMPLAQALPVRLQRQPGGSYGPARGSVRLTRAGASSAMVQLPGGEGGEPWSTLPALADYQRLGDLKPAAAALLEIVVAGEARPLLIAQPYGLGTTAVLASASTWRWRMATPANDHRHTVFWRQLLRQLAEAAQQPRDLSVAVAGQDVVVRLAQRDAVYAPQPGLQAAARVTAPDGGAGPFDLAATDQPGVLRGSFQAAQSGVYRIDLSVAGEGQALTRFVRVGAQQPEYFQAQRNTALLTRIAEVTGGRYWDLQDSGALARALNFSSAGVTQRERLPLWDMPAAFLLLLVLKASEWLLRRHWGRI